MTLAKLRKRYRAACALTAMSQGATSVAADRLNVHLIFVPPDRRARDDQNCMAAMKAGLDGVADVLKVDDSHWRTSYELESSQVGGFVRVEISLPVESEDRTA